MVNRDLLALKLADLHDKLQRVRLHVPDSAVALGQDRDALDLVAFNLMLSVQICSDICSHLISDEGWPAARSLAHGFARLAEEQVISEPVADRLKLAVGLRNVVAHGYAGIDVERCYTAATEGLADLEAFAQEVSIWVSRVGE